MDNLGSRGLFTAILVALVSVHVQKFFTDRAMVIRMPAGVPPIVAQSFASLNPLFFLLVLFWLVRFVARRRHQPRWCRRRSRPWSLPSTRCRASWSMRWPRHGALVDRHQWRQRRRRLVAPIFLQYLSANVAAMTDGRALPYVTAYGFFTTFVNVGGTGATIALALLLVQLFRRRLPQDQPHVSADADLSDQRADFLRPADRPQSRLHDSLHPERADSDDRQLPPDALGLHPQTVRQRPMDDAADHRALSGVGRRLEGGGLGGGFHRDRDAGVLSLCPGRGTGAAAARAVLRDRPAAACCPRASHRRERRGR